MVQIELKHLIADNRNMRNRCETLGCEFIDVTFVLLLIEQSNRHETAPRRVLAGLQATRAIHGERVDSRDIRCHKKVG
jgi:hypothetical protein